jgi:23S rRNA (guanosine2251-2'-O)-methyltransferase
MLVYGKNSIIEAIRSEKTFNRLFVDKNSRDKSTQEIIDLARANGIKIDFIDKVLIERKLSNLDNKSKINHQGVVGDIVEFEYSEIEDIFNLAKEKNESPFILILDGVEDPHNLGAIIRTAECAGVHGVIIPENRACSVNDTVLKTSAGAAANVNVVKVVNLSRTIELLKDRGVWVYACEVGGKNLFKEKLTGPIALVVGSEGHGISRLVKEKCDNILTIPMKGKINSLNVSVAAAIAIFEVVRNR